MENNIKKKVQHSTRLCMELTDEIIGMKYGEAPDYDYLIELLQEVRKNQIDILESLYKNEYENRVEIPNFMKAV